MGAFGEFFGFDGRINRLGYLWRSIVIVIALTVLAGAGVWAVVYFLAPQGVVGADQLVPQVLTGVYLLALWSAFALSSRRLRDMGLEPAHVVPIYAALWVVNSVLLEPMSRLDPHDYGFLENVWVALQWLITLPLLFWPSAPRTDAPPKDYGPEAGTSYLNWRESG